MYQQAQPEGTPDNGAQQNAGGNDGNTFDAEYTVDGSNLTKEIDNNEIQTFLENKIKSSQKVEATFKS